MRIEGWKLLGKIIIKYFGNITKRGSIFNWNKKVRIKEEFGVWVEFWSIELRWDEVEVREKFFIERGRYGGGRCKW